MAINSYKCYNLKNLNMAMTITILIEIFILVRCFNVNIYTSIDFW